MKNINERNNFVFEFRPVTELFEEQVKLHPEKCAVVSGKESFTYAQLNERANRIANALVEKGVRREIIVGVVLERCCDFYAVRQGILKAGGAFAVATPDYPDDRIRYIFEDSGAPFIITTKEIAEERGELFAKLPCTVLLIEELLENENTENPQVKIGEHDLCYCIYTSGSTGKPKGVMIEHRNLLNLIEYITQSRNTSPDDIVAEFASFCFDASVIDLFAPLTAGAVLYILPESIRKDAIAISRYIKEKEITTATFPTQMGELVTELLEDAPALKFVTLGGEKFKHYRNRTYQMINGYGPTENTVSSTEFWVDRQYDNIPIGKSQRNVRSYIVDENLNRLPASFVTQDGRLPEDIIIFRKKQHLCLWKIHLLYVRRKAVFTGPVIWSA